MKWHDVLCVVIYKKELYFICLIWANNYFLNITNLRDGVPWSVVGHLGRPSCSHRRPSHLVVEFLTVLSSNIMLTINILPVEDNLLLRKTLVTDLSAVGFELRTAGFQSSPTYRFEPSSNHLPSTQLNKLMSCTQIMLSSNILHVEDNLLQYYLYGKKVTVVGFEPGFDSDLFETLSRPLPVGCRCRTFSSNIPSTQVNKVMTLFKASGVWRIYGI